MVGVCEEPWPCCGMKGFTSICAPVSGLPLESDTCSFHVFIPRCGGAGSPETRTNDVPPFPVFVRFATYVSRPGSLSQLTVAASVAGSPVEASTGFPCDGALLEHA